MLYRCHSNSHVVTDCPNDVVFNFCFATGHRERDCEDRAEQDGRKKYGEYYTEIKEERQESLGAEDIHVTEQATNTNITGLHKSRSSRSELEFDLSNFV